MRKRVFWHVALVFVVLLSSGCDDSKKNEAQNEEIENVAPVAYEQNLIVPFESESFEITLMGTDANLDTLSYRIISQPQNGTLSGSGANIVYTPDTDFLGEDSFTYSVNDGIEDSEIQTVNLHIEHIHFSFTTKNAIENELSTPELIATYSPFESSMIDSIASLEVSNDGTLFVGDSQLGISVIDVTDPTSLLGLDILDPITEAFDIVFSTDQETAYVAAPNDGLAMVDISNTSNISLIETIISVDEVAFSVALSSDDTKAYVLYYDGLLIIEDVNDTSNPINISVTDLNVTSSTPSITLSGDGETAFIAALSDGLKIVDVSDPTSPSVIYTFESDESVYDVAISDDNTIAYIAASDHFIVLDISDLSAPSELETYELGSNLFKKVRLSRDGQKVFLVDGSGAGDAAMVVLNVSNSTRPLIIGEYANIGNGGNAIALSQDEQIVYYGDDGDGLFILDVSKDFVYKPVGFGTDTIVLRIASEQEIPLEMSVSADRDDIFTVGNYDMLLEYDEYNGVDVEIPITSGAIIRDVTQLTVTLSYGSHSVTRTIYVETDGD